MPKNPEREGSPRLITISEIAEEYGVSRATVHNYRRSGTFPRPAPVEGTEKTKLRFRVDEVAAWFAANPKRQGARTDLATKKQQQGEPEMSEARSAVGRDDERDRERLLDTAVLVEARWPGEYSALCRDLRDLADTIAEEADA
ncbi:helix-turn-helix transcriptional regulator [Streptomyces sp. bgisy154]|uniref:helix-turn-helix transcriptional regulator n=1 Tax=Streptomyces sp. bgisy154 TaxID=3413794 RepID=UPI003D738750